MIFYFYLFIFFARWSMEAECVRWNCYFFFKIFGCEHVVFDFEFFAGPIVFVFCFIYVFLFCIF